MPTQSDNMYIIIFGIVILVIIIGCWYKVYVYNEPSLSKCINYDVQKKIADDINEKLKELDLCDCGSGKSNIDIPHLSSPEKFGNINFY